MRFPIDCPACGSNTGYRLEIPKDPDVSTYSLATYCNHCQRNDRPHLYRFPI